MRIPKEIEQKVVRKLYADAKALDWANLSPQQHSAQYAGWVADAEVGGRLCQYLAEAEARVWIKDGPMKEWSRSLSGVGKYAELVDGADDLPKKLVHKALGIEWDADRATIRPKPLRVVARKGEDETVVTWGGSRDLKHLVWAALSADAEGDTRPWVVCIVGSFTKPTPANERNAQLRLASRCELKLVHVIV